MAEEKNLDQILRDGNNKFTSQMFYEVVNSNTDSSVVLSAFSVMTPLAQLALASVGESHDELLESIGMPNDNVTKAVFSSINTQLRSIKGVTLKTASKIYVADQFELNPEFVAVTRDSFGSEVQKVDFEQSNAAASKINSWIEAQTNNRIKDAVSPAALNKYTTTILVNAIYFKGSWQNRFNKIVTKEQDFYITNDRVIQIPTMTRQGHYKYTSNKELNAEILEIPYEGGESSFLIVLPQEVDGINELKEKLKDPTVLERATRQLTTVEAVIYIPKFKIETATDLGLILRQINVSKIFNPNEARLDKLITNPDGLLYVNSATQKAFIEINEDGAEAAAVNVFGVYKTTSVQSYKPEPIIFRANKPFYFAVKTNSLTLFNGVMHGK